MTRALPSAAIDSDWKLVSHGRPCPVCGAEDTCGVHMVDDFACCARAPSDWKLTNGSWLHRLQSQRVGTQVTEIPVHAAMAAHVNGLRS